LEEQKENPWKSAESSVHPRRGLRVMEEEERWKYYHGLVDMGRYVV
jgi:hypothetical protein